MRVADFLGQALEADSQEPSLSTVQVYMYAQEAAGERQIAKVDTGHEGLRNQNSGLIL